MEADLRVEVKQLMADYHNLFGDLDNEAGQRVLKDLERLCAYNAPTYRPGQTTAEESIYHEGKRWVILHIKHNVERFENERR